MRAKFFFISIRVLIIQTMGRHQYTYYYSLVVASPMCEKKSKDFDEQRSLWLWSKWSGLMHLSPLGLMKPNLLLYNNSSPRLDGK
jgi:hypothetical protein